MMLKQSRGGPLALTASIPFSRRRRSTLSGPCPIPAPRPAAGLRKSLRSVVSGGLGARGPDEQGIVRGGQGPEVDRDQPLGCQPCEVARPARHFEGGRSPELHLLGDEGHQPRLPHPAVVRRCSGHPQGLPVEVLATTRTSAASDAPAGTAFTVRVRIAFIHRSLRHQARVRSWPRRRICSWSFLALRLPGGCQQRPRLVLGVAPVWPSNR